MEVFFTFLISLALSWFDVVSVKTPPPATSTTAIVTRVIDGDTIDVQIAGTEHRVRYIGIDTPEPYRDGEPACYSAEATAENKSWVKGKTVTLFSDKENTDRYDRLLRYVYVGDVMVNAELVQNGFATVLPIAPNTTNAKLFGDLEKEAEVAGVGLWSACQ